MKPAFLLLFYFIQVVLSGLVSPNPGSSPLLAKRDYCLFEIDHITLYKFILVEIDYITVYKYRYCAHPRRAESNTAPTTVTQVTTASYSTVTSYTTSNITQYSTISSG